MDKESLIKAVESGTFSPEQIEALNTTVRLSMASSLVESINTFGEVESQISSITGRISKSVADKISAALESDTLTLEDAMAYLDKLNSIQVRSAETKRKIFNGKEMFSINPMTQQEQALMQMLKQVNTSEKRKHLEDYLAKLVEADFGEGDKPIDNGNDDFDE